MNFSRDYLLNVVATATPELAGDFNIEEHHEVYYDYCQLRNAARDLLYNPEDAEVQRKLSHLIVKLRANKNGKN